MIENELRLKAKCFLVPGDTYSICLRGARRFENDLNVYDGNKFNCAIVKSQLQFRFCDLIKKDVEDNYNPEVRDVFALHRAMDEAYRSVWDERMIVTILRFEII